MKLLQIIFRKNYLTLAAFFISLNSFAQTATIKGIIKDTDTGKPADDVIVSITQIHSNLHTDTAGNFMFSSLSPGTYDLVYRKFGYEKDKTTINIAEGETVQ